MGSNSNYQSFKTQDCYKTQQKEDICVKYMVILIQYSKMTMNNHSDFRLN